MKKLLSSILILVFLVGNIGTSFGETSQYGPYDYKPASIGAYGGGLEEYNLILFSDNFKTFYFLGKIDGKVYVFKNGVKVSCVKV